MTEQTSAVESVRRNVTVQGPPEHAFRVFTEAIGSWWPLETYMIGAKPAVAAVIEPRAGGRWFERDADGGETDWGRVLAYEPPHRIVLSWEITCDWHHDAAIATEVEVTFTADDGATRVELEHRGLDSYGPDAEQMREIFGSEGGWSGLLAHYATAANA
jgi:uncharacterized protein YndB with AHSA1/START domain